MKHFIIALSFTLLIGCSAKVSDQSDLAAAKQDRKLLELCNNGECACDTPVGAIAHNSKITVYSKENVSCNEGCGAYARDVICNNGKLSEDVAGSFFKCDVLDCEPCILQTSVIRSGESVDVYQRQTVDCRDSCDNYRRSRTCRLGELSGDPAYQHFSCERKTCQCELPGSNAFITLDGRKKFYSREQAECGKKCDVDYAQTRTCVSQTNVAGITAFQLNGDAAFRFSSCTEATGCFCTLPGTLGVLNHGDSMKISSVESVRCAESCDSKPLINVVCDNGILKDKNRSKAVVDFSLPANRDYKYQCTVKSCAGCPIPEKGITILNGDIHKFARSASPACGGVCDIQPKKCVNGVFSLVGPGINTDYPAASCELRKCYCSLSSQPGYRFGLGSEVAFYSSDFGTCALNCNQRAQTKTCQEQLSASGQATYSFRGADTHMFQSCVNAQGCKCQLPGNLGEVVDGKTVKLITTPTIACTDSCDDVPSISLQCRNGTFVRADNSTENSEVVDVLQATFPYKYFCVQTGCVDCPLPGFGAIRTGANPTLLYSKSVLQCGDKVEDFAYEFSCTNGALKRLGASYDPQSDPNRPAVWHPSYSVNCPGCELPWGGYLALGAKINAYKHFGTVVNACGRGCKVTERLCKDGVLLGDASYNLSECNNKCFAAGGGAPPRMCLLRWQNSYVTPDAQIPMWSKKQVGCNDSCQNYFKLGRCKMDNGVFEESFDYMYPSCQEVCP